jgi:hypothetical protein
MPVAAAQKAAHHAVAACLESYMYRWYAAKVCHFLASGPRHCCFIYISPIAACRRHADVICTFFSPADFVSGARRQSRIGHAGRAGLRMSQIDPPSVASHMRLSRAMFWYFFDAFVNFVNSTSYHIALDKQHKSSRPFLLFSFLLQSH